MNRKCLVPSCSNTGRNSPRKVFVHINNNLKREWCHKLNIGFNYKRHYYCCEDHLNLEEDLENYQYFKLMKGRAKLKPTAKLRLQTPCGSTTASNCPASVAGNSDSSEYESPELQRLLLQDVPMKQGVHHSSTNIPRHLNVVDADVLCKAITGEKSVQSTPMPMAILLSPTITTSRSGTLEEDLGAKLQVKVTLKDIPGKRTRSCTPEELLKKRKTVTSEGLDTEADSIATVLVPRDTGTVVTSGSFDMDQDSRTAEKELNKQKEAKTKDIPVENTLVHTVKRIFRSKVDETDFNINNTTSLLRTQLVTDSTQTPEDNEIEVEITVPQIATAKIYRKLKLYTGLPVSCCHLLKVITDKTNIPEHHLLLCLKKIRLDNEFQELADEFAVTPSNASEMFYKNIPLIASAMRPFILKQDLQATKRTLPLAFRLKYYNVSCIIDCLEIKLQNRVYTSSDKKIDTIKYLVSCTPNGVISYVSQGYNGNIIDTCLVQSCDFWKSLRPGMCVMTMNDSSFKGIEHYLHTSGVRLVRTLTVRTDLTETETQDIDDSRKPIESVMRRLREFGMLKRHQCLDMNTANVIDDVVVIACAFVNLRDSIR